MPRLTVYVGNLGQGWECLIYVYLNGEKSYTGRQEMTFLPDIFHQTICDVYVTVYEVWTVVVSVEICFVPCVLCPVVVDWLRALVA